jgi:O-succinylbenzoate synthase
MNAGGDGGAALLRLSWRRFSFVLPTALVTAHGAVSERRGWLLRLENAEGAVGWGEAAPLGLAPEARGRPCQVTAAALADLGPARSRLELEGLLPTLPAALGFALGSALAELEGRVGPGAGGWRPAPPAAWLLPAGEHALAAVDRLLASQGSLRPGLTFKWKVAAAADGLERAVLEELLGRLRPTDRLRLDANGGWDRATAARWADRLMGEPRLDWIEQPLPPADGEGLWALAVRLPVALDESLRADPGLCHRWPGWQVRRPALEGDPRPLLAQLRAGVPWLMVSTALETGVARRWIHHLAALQADGPTPTAPGLAPGWTPDGPLFDADPERVWEAAVA